MPVFATLGVFSRPINTTGKYWGWNLPPNLALDGFKPLRSAVTPLGVSLIISVVSGTTGNQFKRGTSVSSLLVNGVQTFAHKTIAHKTVAHKTIAHKTIAHNLYGK